MLEFVQDEIDAHFVQANLAAIQRRYGVESLHHRFFAEELYKLRSITPKTLHDNHWLSHFQTMACLAYFFGEHELDGQCPPPITKSVLIRALRSADGTLYSEFLEAVGFQTVVPVYVDELRLCFDIMHGDRDASYRCPELFKAMEIVGRELHQLWENQSEAKRIWSDFNERLIYIKRKMLRRDKKHPVSFQDQCARLELTAHEVSAIDNFSPEQAALVFQMRPSVFISLMTEKATPSALAELATKTGYVGRMWRSRDFSPTDELSTASAASTGAGISTKADPDKVKNEFDKNEDNIISLDDFRTTEANDD